MWKCPCLCPVSSLQAGEEAWANRFQSDETVTETQTPVSSFSYSAFFDLWFCHNCVEITLSFMGLYRREAETSRFSDAVKTLSAKMNPLADIGEHLRKKMRQEEEQGPS